MANTDAYGRYKRRPSSDRGTFFWVEGLCQENVCALCKPLIYYCGESNISILHSLSEWTVNTFASCDTCVKLKGSISTTKLGQESFENLKIARPVKAYFAQGAKISFSKSSANVISDRISLGAYM